MTKFVWLALIAIAPAFSQPLHAGELTYEDLVSLIKTNDIKSIGELNAKLPKDFRTHATFVHKSQSMQGADMTNPRAIIFGKMASLILAHNGHPNQPRYHSLEVMQWRPEKRALELRHIDFPKDGKGDVTFSNANPAKCTTCHGRDPVWKWDQPYTWDGAFGLTADVVEREEKENFLKFKERAAKHDRYGHLFIKSPNEVWPYAGSNETRYWKDTSMPNAALSVQITAMNGQRLARLVQASPEFSRLKHMTLYALSGCTSVFPREVSEKTIATWTKTLSGTTGGPLESLLELLFRRLQIDQKDVYPNIDPEIKDYRDGISNTVDRPSTVLDYAGAAIVEDLKRKKHFEDIATPPFISRLQHLDSVREEYLKNRVDLNKFPVALEHFGAVDHIQHILDLRKGGKAFCEYLKTEGDKEVAAYEAALEKHGEKAVGH